MYNKNVALAIILGLTVAKGVFAADPETKKEEFDINSVVFIEEEPKIELGFDTADYLPENFNPYKVYFDLDSVKIVEDEFKMTKRMSRKLARRLPKDFDAYAYPTDVEGFNYIDENDEFEVDFDTKKYLPQGFNAYAK